MAGGDRDALAGDEAMPPPPPAGPFSLFDARTWLITALPP